MCGGSSECVVLVMQCTVGKTQLDRIGLARGAHHSSLLYKTLLLQHALPCVEQWTSGGSDEGAFPVAVPFLFPVLPLGPICKFQSIGSF